MNNNEKFNQKLNECENPHLMLAILLALSPIIRESKNPLPDLKTLLDDLPQ